MKPTLRKRQIEPKKEIIPEHKFNECLRCVLDGESHYVRLNNETTYCGKSVKSTIFSNSIEIITCNKCVNVFLYRGIF